MPAARAQGQPMPPPICGAIGSACPQDVASERPSATLNAFRVAPGSLAGSLGRAGACRRDYLFDLDADNLLRHTVYAGLREDKPAEQVRREP